jgi:hypothetical protein
MLRRVGLGLVVTWFVLLLWQSHASAQSVTNLQADIYNLRSQVSQLQQQVNQLSQGSSPRITAPAPRTSSPSGNLSDRQMLDRLAVLAIEAKDRLNSLEARVTRLEKR